MKIRNLLIALLAFIGLQQPAYAQSFASDIKAAPQRFWNRGVELEGQVTAVQADYPGSTKGQYILVDESDGDGILVRTKALPGPGQTFRVSGMVVQDKQNASLAVIQEVERKVVRPDWLKPVLIGAAVLVVLLVVVLTVSIRSKSPAVAPVGNSMASPMAMPMAMPMGMPMASPVTSFPAAPMPSYPQAPMAAAVEVLPPTMVFEPTANATQVFLRARLQVTSGADAGKDFPIADSPLCIGRGRTATGGRVNHVVLSDRTVSSAQATIRHDAAKGTFTIVNDSVTNRTTVDGEQRDVSALNEGSTIQIGATTLVFHRD